MTQRELTNRLNIASIKYYRGESTEYTDTQFDLALKELQLMEKESGVVYPDSPTLRVGSDLQKEFKKVKHPFPMLTIENTYNNEELDKWATKMSKEWGARNFNVEVKFDGISCELYYKGGHFVNASTRGDKNIGDDITLNVYGVHDIPFELIGFGKDEEFWVRGEILMPKSVLSKLNEERVNSGEPLFANTRNACAGSIKQLDHKITATRGLIFRAWDCFGPEVMFASMQAKNIVLNELGFRQEFTPVEYNLSPEYSLSAFVEEQKKKLDSMNLDYDYDGMVIKINETNLQMKIGTKDTRAIEWGIARKWNEEYEVWTELQGVEWQVGRTGVVTPVGLLEPVECAGVKIANVTLHNVDFIKRLDLHYGNDLRITRSGGVIPYVLECKHDLLMELHGAYKPVVIPDVCPVCGGALKMDGKILRCVNKSCPAQERGKVLQFCSKDCMDIKSVGPAVIDDLFDSGLISSLADFVSIGQSSRYSMAYMLEKLGEGYGEKKIQKIFDNMNEAREKKTWANVLSSLSIPNVGKVMARAIVKRYDCIFDLERFTVEDLTKIDGIGEVVAKGIVDWVSDEDNKYLLDRIHYWGWNWIDAYDVIDDADNNPQDLRLNGLSVVFSGSSSRFSGDAIEEFLEENGAKCSHSVSKKTNYLIIGEKPGPSKVKKAEDCGVEIITEDDFFKKFGIEFV